MKRKRTRSPQTMQLMISWSNSYYIEWLDNLEKALRKKPRRLRIDIIGTGEVPADAALQIRQALLKRSPKTRIVVNARSTIQNGSVLIWLLGDTRLIRDDARVFFRRADLPDDAEVDANADWKAEPKYHDSHSAIDPDEGDQARVLQLINEFLPVNELIGRLISPAVLKQFGLIDNDHLDGFLSTAFGGAGQTEIAKR